MNVLTQVITVLHFKLCFPQLTIYRQFNIFHGECSIYLDLHFIFRSKDKSKLFKTTPEIKSYFHRTDKCYRLCSVRATTLSVRTEL